MNDEQMRPLLDTLYRDREIPRPKVQTGVAKVMTQVPQTRQRGRWWPLPAFHGKTQTTTATDTTEYQPSPIPATSGHAPTVIGRTQTMFSPVKAIIGGALIFALSAAFLVAQPFDQQGGVPGAEQGADPAAPVEVTATHRSIACEGYDSSDVEGRVVRVYGNTCTVDNEWSDPRLQGTERYIDNYVDHADSGLTIGHYVHNIVTDDGAWRMRPQFRFESPGLENFSGTWVLDGEGAYEGLSVVLAKEGDDSVPLTGYIISTDLVPPAPEGASTK
jgi:hypothetical protein